MIKIERLCKSFDGFTAVDNLSFSVGSGEVLGFLGPNGAGKSTTMKMICGFLKADAGSIRVFGHDVAHAPLAVKQLIGYLPEGAPAWGEMTPADYLDFIADIRQLNGDKKRQRIATVVEQLALESVLSRPIDTLSKGFKRRVGIAQALLHDPRVLILDEPTDGLDPNQKHQVRELIRGLATDKIVIISTHILEEVNAVCSRAVIIANGKLLADNTPAELELHSRYHNAVTLEFESHCEIKNSLSGLPGIASVEQSATAPNHYTVFPQSGAEIYASVATLSRENNWPLKALHVERGRLDDVFREITQQPEQANEDATR